LAYSRCTSETSVEFQGTTRRHIPEDGTFDFIFLYVSLLVWYPLQFYHCVTLTMAAIQAGRKCRCVID
jgi:hypothetical protein